MKTPTKKSHQWLKVQQKFRASARTAPLLIQPPPIVDVQKGKQVVDYVQSCTTTRHSLDGRQKVHQKWEPPPANRVKLNVDGSFIPDGSAGTGMALRDSAGSSIFVACGYLFRCSDIVDATLAAMEEGLALALQWSPLSVSVETDCDEVVALVQSSTPTCRAIRRVSRIFVNFFRKEMSRSSKSVAKPTL